MNQSLAITVTESSQVGEARRAASALAEAAGLDQESRGKVALAVTEAATNLVQHSGSRGEGQIILRLLQGSDGKDQIGVEMLALDRGSGITDTAQAFRDGFSTAGTAGQGLGAIRRQASFFDLYSQPDAGTALLFQLWSTERYDPTTAASATGPWELGVVSLPKNGEEICGDAWAAIADRSGNPSRFLVADGLGHGPLAAEASREAVRVFLEQSEGGAASSPSRVLSTAHAALRSTRGAAAAVAFVDTDESDDSLSVRFSGVGNIAGVLFTPEGSHGLASHNGTVGHQVTRFHEFVHPTRIPALLIMASDGLTSQWQLDRYPGLLNRHPALIAGILYRDFNRGRDDVTVLVAKLTGRKGAVENVA